MAESVPDEMVSEPRSPRSRQNKKPSFGGDNRVGSSDGATASAQWCEEAQCYPLPKTGAAVRTQTVGDNRGVRSRPNAGGAATSARWNEVPDCYPLPRTGPGARTQTDYDSVMNSPSSSMLSCHFSSGAHSISDSVFPQYTNQLLSPLASPGHGCREGVHATDHVPEESGERPPTSWDVDLCFMVDCTDSMSRWVRQIKLLHQRIRDTYNSRCHIRVAFVAYYDLAWEFQRQNFVVYVDALDFTSSPEEFCDKVAKVVVNGGGDSAEDVMTGFEVALKLSWKGSIKLVIHIADQPGHGLMYHHRDVIDTYPGGDPIGRSHVDMMRMMACNNIQYCFGVITKHTGKMIHVFNECLKQESCGRLSVNTFDASKPEDEGFSTALLSAVHSSIAHSVSEGRIPLELRPACKEIDPALPTNLERCAIMSATAMSFKMPPSIDDDILQSATMKLVKSDVVIRMAAKPFAQGHFQLSYHGLDTVKYRRVVLKQSRFANPERNRLKRYLENMEVQVITARFLADFKKQLQNGIVCAGQQINVLNAKVIMLQGATCEQDKFMTMEPHLGEDSTKLSSIGYGQPAEDEPECIIQAFSHWTYFRSGKSLVIVNAQSSVYDGVIYLTHPAIHSIDRKRFSKTTNCGKPGMDMFLAAHECNRLCNALNILD
ncbi:alpha-protein kinase vwkA-like [Sycon ciliatum]|uniref:alpha-protein kinase vwkA-like n=1 Tax=Sycon ciliatum TaxID=27933 RepID=UPI0031F63B08